MLSKSNNIRPKKKENLIKRYIYIFSTQNMFSLLFIKSESKKELKWSMSMVQQHLKTMAI